MDFHTAQEAAAYRMLRQVLSNHIQTHALAFASAYAAVLCFLCHPHRTPRD